MTIKCSKCVDRIKFHNGGRCTVNSSTENCSTINPSADLKNIKKRVRKKVMIYCQSSYGLGHFILGINLAKGLVQDNEVLLVYGGERYSINIPKKIRFLQLDVLKDDPQNRRELIGNDQDVDMIKRKRIRKITAAYHKYAPEIILIEHFPFGRTNYQFEIMPLLDMAKRDGRNIICIKGVISRNQYDQQKIKATQEIIQSYFRSILVCTDPDLETLDEEISTADFQDKILYCGYVVGKQRTQIIEREKIRESLKLKEEKLVVVSVGGGIEGFKRIEHVINSLPYLEVNIRLMIFTGPQICEEEYDKIQQLLKNTNNIIVRKFDPDIIDYMNAADLVLSMAGINSFAENLLVNANTIFLPLKNNEQDCRVNNVKQRHNVCSIDQDVLSPEVLAKAINDRLNKKATYDYNLCGVANVVRIISA